MTSEEINEHPPFCLYCGCSETIQSMLGQSTEQQYRLDRDYCCDLTKPLGVAMQEQEIIAVFVSKQDWMQYEFFDHTRSRPFVITTGEAFVVIAKDVESAVWAALQTALKNQDQWVLV